MRPLTQESFELRLVIHLEDHHPTGFFVEGFFSLGDRKTTQFLKGKFQTCYLEDGLPGLVSG